MTIREAAKTRCERTEAVLAIIIGGGGIVACVGLWGVPALVNLIVYIGA